MKIGLSTARLGWLIAWTIVGAAGPAWGCPTCKEFDAGFEASVSGIEAAFGASVLFMLGAVGAAGFFMFRMFSAAVRAADARAWERVKAQQD